MMAGSAKLLVKKSNVAKLEQNAGQSNAMFADQPNCLSNGRRLNQVCLYIAFGTRHKESPRSVQSVQAREVDVAFVHDVKRACLYLVLLSEQVDHEIKFKSWTQKNLVCS